MSKSLDRLTLLETFVRIADAGSISAAARDLGLSQPSASRQLAELESRLQTLLVQRNTHSLSLTGSGEKLLTEARMLLDAWESLEEGYLQGDGELSGKLKVIAPIALGQGVLARVACQFQVDHPRVVLDWQLHDQPIRFTEVGCDCWIKVGPVPDDTLVVRQLGIVERLLVGTPSIAKSLPATPKRVQSLGLVALQPFEGGQIPLRNESGKKISIAPTATMSTNNIFALKEATLMGVGASVMPRWFIDRELADGSLVDLLPGWRAPTLGIHVAYLPGRHQPRRLRTFLNAIAAAIPAIPGVASV